MGHLTLTKERPGPWGLGVSSARLLILASVAAAALTVLVYGERVSLGELMLACTYTLLLVVSLVEMGVHRRKAAQAAKVERDAIAKDMHDVLAQDLAFVAGRLRELALKAELEDRHERDLLSLLSSTAHRALDQSRVAVWSLARPDMPLEAAVEHAAQEVARREGAVVLVETQAGPQVSHALKHALLCIVREATTNAVRHGDPSHVVVRLFEDDGIRLEVSDNGNGFDAERPGGFGLTTIRQRVSSWGGSAKITSVPGEGTVVEVHVPSETVTGDGDSDVPTGHRLRRARARLQLVGSAG
jgi:two-component system, NarL family, sensor histidine kinase LiaS